jgi:hypothetical protein
VSSADEELAKTTNNTYTKMSNKFCSTSDICCVVLVKYPVTSHNATFNNISVIKERRTEYIRGYSYIL